MPHIHEQFDFVVSAYIVHSHRVLFVFHKKLKKWLPIGGHIELNENPEQTVYREIKEEAGMSKDVLTLYATKPQDMSPETRFLPTPSYLDVHDISDSHKHIGFVYFFGASVDTISLAEKEHDDIRFFTEHDINNPAYGLSKTTQFYALEALDRVK